jgi:mono/diheme cytochrome c family protein
MAPPILNGEGKKVQSKWLFAFLKNPVPIRPWLSIRMPTFGLRDDEAQDIVAYFQALDDVKNPLQYFDEAKVAPEKIEAGKVLMSTDYFACFSCHQQGDQKPEGPPEGWAPDLGMAHERLNPEWILEWIHDPQKVMPGTKMPSFYPGGPDDVFGGDEAKQIEALRDYIFLLGRGGGRQVAGAAPQKPATASAPAGSQG